MFILEPTDHGLPVPHFGLLVLFKLGSCVGQGLGLGMGDRNGAIVLCSADIKILMGYIAGVFGFELVDFEGDAL
jgi:hypothetical protein